MRYNQPQMAIYIGTLVGKGIHTLLAFSASIRESMGVGECHCLFLIAVSLLCAGSSGQRCRSPLVELESDATFFGERVPQI